MEPAITILLISIAMIAMGLLQKNKFNNSGCWKKASAVVYRMERETSVFNDDHHHSNERPILRFTTERNDWITAKLTNGHIPNLEQGDEVDIIYDPDKPHDFTVDSNLNLKVLPAIFVALGSIGFVFGLLELVELTSLTN